MSSPSPRSAHLPGLDGLRAIAVLAVLVYHLSPGALTGGFLGVDIFFVISGFLITGLVLRERETTGRLRLRAFWLRRARRLLPALGALLLVCSAVAWLIGGDVLLHLGRQLLGAVTFSSNWVAVANDQSYFDETAPELFRNLWSLAVEEQFYLVWPLLVLPLALIRSRRVRVAIVAIIAAGSAVAMAVLFPPAGDATRVYYGTDTHSFGLAIGAVLAILTSRWTVSRLVAARWFRVLAPILGALSLAALVVVASVFTTDAPLVYRGGLVAVALLTAIVIWGSITPGSPLGRALDLAPLRWVGTRSYGIYLWHWPVFVLLVAAFPSWERTGGSGWLLGGVAAAITVTAAALSYRFLEQPIRRDGFRAVAGRWFGGWRGIRGVGTAATVLVVGALVATTTVAVLAEPDQGDAQALIERGKAAIASATAAPTPTPTPSAAPGTPTPGPTELPPPPAGADITAIGDSVMLASAPELQAAFPGIAIDAVVSRQASAAPAIVQGMVDAGILRSTLILGLGTNGPVDESVLERIHHIVGGGHRIVVVDVQAPRGWVPGVNTELGHFADEHRNVELAHWQEAIAGQLNLLARDQIHPGSRGGQVYVDCVKAALQRLDDLPPLQGAQEFWLPQVPPLLRR
ncbi:acyltransferase family protein [Lacisediminihabitans changchengi]|uniref:Acyltransferase n=1 Tax=Lacisediminihabitans changchengi TaxID=2787634 RepID=A0A934SSY3_9MICO|nr:acyltransferase family protein [Lacisediminihabitans changchengi]MBK4348365.1 acyltransferase [Lacisediminihabitans changchengi]